MLHKQPNRFRTKCNRCGYWIEPNKGFIYHEYAASRTWIKEHNECPESDGMNDDGSMDGLQRDWGDL